ncbi:hypothetical protein TNIN_432351 [Trichonephila inaurata madagascariensis]|uniref:Uncharacterized protein n=1 Tax=Trichonephila inaurata madagascariensis TaxID=2747483 RepID=A0A8X7C951_9ARAC|nr:hypothetical protein TNIN_432351 [Trichonephila inaurata madagascariensis]
MPATRRLTYIFHCRKYLSFAGKTADDIPKRDLDWENLELDLEWENLELDLEWENLELDLEWENLELDLEWENLELDLEWKNSELDLELTLEGFIISDVNKVYFEALLEY